MNLQKKKKMLILYDVVLVVNKFFFFFFCLKSWRVATVAVLHKIIAQFDVHLNY